MEKEFYESGLCKGCTYQGTCSHLCNPAQRYEDGLERDTADEGLDE